MDNIFLAALMLGFVVAFLVLGPQQALAGLVILVLIILINLL